MNLAVDVNFSNVFCACWACPEFFLVTFVKVRCAVSYEGLRLFLQDALRVERVSGYQPAQVGHINTERQR